MNKKVINAAKWSVLTEFATKMVSPFVNIILARILMPEAFGAVATITMIISFAEIFTDAGFQKYIVQHEFSDDRDFDESVNVAFWSNLAVSTLFVACIWIFRNYLSKMVGSPELATGIGVASTSILIVAFSSIQMSVYRRKLDFKSLFYVRLVVTSIPLIITVPLSLVFRNYWALVIGTLFRDLTSAILLTLKSNWKPRWYYSIEKFKKMFSYSFWTLCETIAIWITAYAGTFIVGRMLNQYYLGLYKTTMTTINSYKSIMTTSMASVLFSALSRCQNNDKEFQSTFFGFQKIISLFILPMAVGIYLYRDLAVSILLGDQWTEATEFLGMWGFINLISFPTAILISEVYRSKGRPDISLAAQVFYLIILIPSLYISAKIGFRALCLTTCATSLLYMTTAMIIGDRLFNIKISKTLTNIFPEAISVIIMCCISLILKKPGSNRLWDFISILICGGSYFAVLMLFPKERNIVSTYWYKTKNRK